MGKQLQENVRSPDMQSLVLALWFEARLQANVRK